MKDAQKPDHISINTLIQRLREGRFVIPDFQREFEWRPWDIRDLMRSIFLDYYIGSLLLWKGTKENYEALSCENLYGYKAQGNREYIVLDGQQRLTAMYYAFFAPESPLPNRTSRFVYFIHVDKFMAEMHDEAFGYDRLTNRWAKLLKNEAQQFAGHIFPLSVVGAGGWDLPNWVQGYNKYWEDQKSAANAAGKAEEARLAANHAQNAKEFGEHLRGIAEQYQVSYVELDRSLPVDKVCDIFTQINSKGVRLDVFDLINALLKPKGLQLKQLWRETAPRFTFIESDKTNVYILQVMSILRQSYCSPKYLYFLLPGQEKQVRDPDGTRRSEILIGSVDEFRQRWESAVDALDSAIQLLRHPQEFGVASSNYLPYVSILPIFSALQAHVRTIDPNRRLDAQRKIRHGFWASVFTARYSGSVESTSARDFLDVKSWIDNDAAEPSLIAEFATRFRTLDLRTETKRGTSVYNGIFNLLVLQGARDWMSGNIPQHGDLDDHHIVPDSWGREHLNGNLINSILNRTPLTKETNRHVISDRLPNEYLPELIAQNGERQVRAILESHFISSAAFDILLRSPFGPEDFEAFIAERQRTLQDAIENLLIKERLDLPPQFRELDEKVEQIELTLRSVIAATLSNEPGQMPPHLVQKADERIGQALRRNAALDAEQYQTLTRKLEYFDLRDLQEAITNRALWAKFEPRFASKEAVIGKFNQLAELRNGLRHSRTVDEITRKEGEAAILWFEQVLGRDSLPLRQAVGA
ncbi:MAG: GmrSD restriction endonuclease domain-containing protein [Rhizobiaceae bacterium]